MLDNHNVFLICFKGVYVIQTSSKLPLHDSNVDAEVIMPRLLFSSLCMFVSQSVEVFVC